MVWNKIKNGLRVATAIILGGLATIFLVASNFFNKGAAKARECSRKQESTPTQVQSEVIMPAEESSSEEYQHWRKKNEERYLFLAKTLKELEGWNEKRAEQWNKDFEEYKKRCDKYLSGAKEF